MLTRRTNILLNEETYQDLMILSREKGISVGEFIRQAVSRVCEDDQTVEKARRLKAVREIIALWPKTKGKKGQKTDYKALIEYGRRF